MSNVGFPFNAGASINIGGAGITTSINFGSQQFQTAPVTNTRLALYTLSIRAPSSPFSAFESYTFPLSPAALSKRVNAMSNIYDVAGQPSQGGVQRLVDAYGNAPPVWSIEGTTGWQRHATDGFGMDGIDSILTLQQFLQGYAQLNALQEENDQPSYILEFYDYFLGDFWQIEPIGPQEIRQNRQRPILVDYSFRWAGITEVGSNLNFLTDPIQALFSVSATRASITLQTNLSTLLTSYESITPGSAAILDGAIG